ncbi:MAG: M1 family aminopeptidase [Flavobacteriales bacterium]
MLHSRSISALILCFSLFSTVAQPYKYGCHYFRNQGDHRYLPTAMEKSQIDETIARSDTFDILHYDINMDVTDYANELIKASTTITYTPLMAGQDFIRFDLFSLTVDSVTDANGPMSYGYDGDFLRVDFLQQPQVGTNYQITVHYRGTPHRDPEWGGFYFEADYIYNLGIGLSTIPPNFGKVWYPCFDSFVERATYTYTVKSAGGRVAHCMGDMVNETLLGGDTVVRTFDFSLPIPTHLSAIAVAAYVDSNYTHTGAYGPVPVRLSAKSNQLNAMSAKLVDLGGAIDACEYWYGQHAFERVGYALTTDGALEIPTNIAYPQFMTGGTEAENRGLYSHELGHHWFGDAVAPRVHNDMWLKEGPAEYASHLFEEWLYGEDAFVKVVKDNQLFVLEQAHLQDGGFQALSPMPDAYIYGLHTYYKGAAVLHNLRGYLGDSLFRVGLHYVQEQLAFNDMTPQQFRDTLEAGTGADLHPFFDAWVFAPGFAAFVVDDMTAAQNGGQWNVDLLLRQKLRGTSAWHHQVPLDLTLVGANWQRQEFRVMADDEFSNVSVTADFEPVMAILNGHNRLNQARMDYEFTIPANGSFPSVLPYTKFRLYDQNLVDTALFRVEHIWSGPDADNLGYGVDELSDTHYWTVDGIWPAGTELQGKLYYDATDATDLDFPVYGATEADAILVYRATASDPWELYPDLVASLGSLTDGIGNFTMNNLRKGQYAFARGSAVIGIADHEQPSGQLQVFPVPVNDMLTVRGQCATSATALFDVFDAAGRLVLRSTAKVSGGFEQRIAVADLPPGSFSIVARTANGEQLGTARFEVAR